MSVVSEVAEFSGIRSRDLVSMVMASGRLAVGIVLSLGDHVATDTNIKTFTDQFTAWCHDHGTRVSFSAPGKCVAVIPAKRLSDVAREIADVRTFLAQEFSQETDAKSFLLPGQSAEFLSTVGAQTILVPDTGKGNERKQGLDLIVRTHESMANLDISNCIRERPIFAFEEHTPSRHIATELVTDVKSLTRDLGLDILNHPWLLGFLVRAIDRRILDHIHSEPSHRKDGFGFNLNAETLLSDSFTNFIKIISGDLHGDLAIDIDYMEWKTEPEKVSQAAQRAKDAGFSLCLDNVPAESAGNFDLPLWANSFVKIDWRHGMDEQAPLDFSELNEQTSDWAKGRVVLLQCTTPDIINAALAADFRKLEGFEVAAFANTRNLALDNRMIGDVPVDKPASKPKSWLFGRLFRRS